jgi:DNA-binding Xre family transcriptional regulator
MNIGKSIQIALVNKGWQKKDLAEKLGVTRSTISNMVQSETCTGKALAKLCEVFEMQASDFIALGE